ncbi:MAG: ATP-binding protein [Nitrospirota bacterium]
MQGALEISEKRYKKMVEAVTVYTYSVQVSKGNVIYSEHSIGCLPITGYSREEFKSDPHLWYSMIYPDDKTIVENTIKEIMVGKKVFPIEHRIIRRDGGLIWIRNTLAPYYNEDGALIRYDGLIEDISERKHTEQELKHLSDELKRSNEDLNRFASAASHDLQEPLRGIEGFIKLLQKRYKGKLDEKADEFIDYVVEDVKRMQMLINDLLEYSRVSAKNKVVSPVNCSVALEQAYYNLRSAIDESGAEVTYDLLPTVMGDDAQFIRLFQNLIGNAIKFRGKEPLKIHISAHREGDEWTFSIRDNAIGIDPEQAERIFVIFQRLHSKQEYPGTGLGLALCKRIVEHHGGRIWVESKPDSGATFYFTIPERQEHLLELQGEESSDKSSDS